MQTAHLRRNGPGDQGRFGFIEHRGYDLFVMARRGFRRWERSQRSGLLPETVPPHKEKD